MSLAFRRILYLTFIFSFFILTAIVFGFASGYAFNFQNRSIVKTGALVLNTDPEGAQVFLNGDEQFAGSVFEKKTQIVTPAKIKNLVPGEYEVRLVAKGYAEWKKKLIIKPGEATFAETVHLFSEDKPRLIDNSQNILFTSDFANRRVLFRSATDYKLIDLNDGALLGTFPQVASTKYQDLVSDGVLIDKIFYKKLSVTDKIDLPKISSSSMDQVALDKYSGNVYFLNKNSVKFLDVNSGLTTNLSLATGTVPELIKVSDNQLLLIAKTNGAQKLYYFVNGKPKGNLDLQSSFYTLDWQDKEIFWLTDLRNQIIYRGDFSTGELTDVINSASMVQPIDNDKILYANDHEILVYSNETKKSQLITRVSGKIDKLYLHSTKNYVIYSTGNVVFALEMDERDRRNTTDLITFDSINNIDYDQSTDQLLVSGRYRSQDGLFLFKL